MVISGGFTDEDWETFPVWAYELSSPWVSMSMSSSTSTSADETWKGEEEHAGAGGNLRPAWTELARSSSSTTTTEATDEYVGAAGKGPTKDNVRDKESPTSSPNDVPRGRVGHLSSVHNDCLYVFGGLMYEVGTFRVDVPTDGSNTIVIWKACGLDDALRIGNTTKMKEQKKTVLGKMNGGELDGDYYDGLRWERIVPKVVTTLPTRSDTNYEEEDADEEDDDGIKIASETTNIDDGGGGDSKGDHDRLVMTTNAAAGNRKMVEKVIQDRIEVVLTESTPASFTLPRGESQGGHYHNPNGDDCFIFHGGMHNYNSLTGEMQVLGDVWKYDYDSQTLSVLSPYPPLPWQRDNRNGLYPVARTAHAGTIVGHELILHGGMHFGVINGEKNDDRGDSTSTTSGLPSSDTYLSYKTKSRWQSLSDVWVFDLVTLTWKERVLYPQLTRSYHSLVGSDNGTIAIYGGFQQDQDIPGETIAFVFNDLLVSRPNETYWLKLIPPYETITSDYGAYGTRPGITNRLEHSAVLDRYGSMYVWGGRYQKVNQIFGLWRLDVFTTDSKLKYINAPPDNIVQYEAELEAMHMFIAMMMFMSLTLSSLLSLMRRQTMEGAHGGSGGGRSSLRRGLSREVIDSLPLRHYKTPTASTTIDDEVVLDVSLHREEDCTSCCPICFVDFADGMEIRTLPCGHEFSRDCIDSWLLDHTTCPTCRTNVDNIPLIREEEDSSTPSIITVNNRSEVVNGWYFDGRRLRRRSSGFQHFNAAADSSMTIDDHEVTRPRFLGIRSLFGGRGRHVGLAVPSNDEEEIRRRESIVELVIV